MVHVVVLSKADAMAVKLARRCRTAATIGLVAVLAGFAWVLAVVPSIVGFVLAVCAIF